MASVTPNHGNTGDRPQPPATLQIPTRAGSATKPTNTTSAHEQLNPFRRPEHPAWRELFDGWLREPAIRRTMFAAFICALITVVALPLAGGPLALTAVVAPLTGGTGYAVWRGRKSP